MLPVFRLGLIATCPRPAGGSPPPPPPPTHELHLRFEGGFTDYSPLGHSVTNSGATLDTTVFAEGASSARIATAVGNNVITVPHHSALNIPAGDFTIGCRVRFSSIGSASVIYTKSFGTGSYPYQIIRDSGNAIVFRGTDGAAVVFSCATAAGYVQANTWYRVQGRRSGNTFELAVNGVQVASATFTGTLMNDTAPVSVGNYSSGGYPVVGWLDDVTFDSEAVAFTA